MPRSIFSVRNSGREFSGIEADWELFFSLSTLAVRQRHCGMPRFCPQRVLTARPCISIFLPPSISLSLSLSLSVSPPSLRPARCFAEARVEIESRKRNVHIQLLSRWRVNIGRRATLTANRKISQARISGRPTSNYFAFIKLYRAYI